jgi:hypothetical protein
MFVENIAFLTFSAPAVAPKPGKWTEDLSSVGRLLYCLVGFPRTDIILQLMAAFGKPLTLKVSKGAWKVKLGYLASALPSEDCIDFTKFPEHEPFKISHSGFI